MDSLMNLQLVYQHIYEDLNIRIYGKPDETWNDVTKYWLNNLPISFFKITDWHLIGYFIIAIIIIIFCGIIRKIISKQFMRVPEAIAESTTLNCETLRNQEDSQISLDLTQLVGKPLEISENIHKTWITTNNQNYQKLYVLTVDVDAYKNPSAKVSEIFDDPIDSKSKIMFEAQNLIEDIINELELSFKNDKITGKSIFDSTSSNLDFNNKSINSHIEHRNNKVGSKIPLRVVSRHRLHSNKLDIQ